MTNQNTFDKIKVSWKWKTNNQKISGFRYLWLKTVNGFNPSYHCAKCLQGEYNSKFSPKMDINKDIIYEYNNGQVIYFCGVSSPYKWANNLHIAGIVKVGCQVKISAYNGDILLINNVSNLPIDNLSALEHFSLKGKEFLTCRNFQFGAKYFKD